jgi:hypothetical protein
MIKNPVFLSIIFVILVTTLSNVGVLAQDEDGDASGSQSEMGVETKMNRTEVSVNLTDVIKSLNFSCDINLNCFDKKNQVELVILTNNTSTVKIPKTFCGDRTLHTNGLLLIPAVNSSLSIDKLESSGIIVDRACNFRNSDMISGIYSAPDLISIEQFFGEKNYSLPEEIILTNKGRP